MTREYYRYYSINVHAALIVRMLLPYKTSLIKVFMTYHGTRDTSNMLYIVRKI